MAETHINSLAMRRSSSKSRFIQPKRNAAETGKGSLVSGHDFSRANNAGKSEKALAPEAISHWTSAGWDEVSYLIATNPGEPIKPLIEIASGGELMSRVMLALKVAVEETSAKSRKLNPTPRTLVFDEIDIGIGGRAA